jgi:hypothetical protein
MFVYENLKTSIVKFIFLSPSILLYAGIKGRGIGAVRRHAVTHRRQLSEVIPQVPLRSRCGFLFRQTSPCPVSGNMA